MDTFGRPAFAFVEDVQHFRIPTDSGQRVARVKNNMAAFSPSSTLLVWIAEWGVWPSSERSHIFERFRLSYGVSQPLIEKRGHLLGPSEHDVAISIVTLSVLFLWDCFVLTSKSGPGLFYSHDEYGVAVERVA